MLPPEEINYVINKRIELNLSFMPFIQNGGLFIPTPDFYTLGDSLVLHLMIPERKEPLTIQGKVVWVISKHALHYSVPGIGIQFTGQNAKSMLNIIKENIDSMIDIGGYSYGVIEENKNL